MPMRHRFPTGAVAAIGLLALALAIISPMVAFANDPRNPPLPDGPRTTAIGNPMPRLGDQKLLVVLADFSDQPGQISGQAWNTFFFGAEGFAHFYRQASYDQLRYSGDIVGMVGITPVVNNTGVAYVRLPQPITYYANGMYGYGGGFPKNNGGVVYDALRVLDAAGFNFTPYADPVTHKVENLVVVFAGKNYYDNGDSARSLLATGYRLSAAGLGGPYLSKGGQQFDNYTFCHEQRRDGSIANIGVCVHEHGHSLGMVDLYDFSYTTAGVGNFDVMAYGTYGVTDGQYPIDFSVFSKELFGWVAPTVLVSGISKVHLRPAAGAADFVKLYPNGDTSSLEYFLLENRQPVGNDRDWERAGLCRGLVIWHVDQQAVQSRYLSNLVDTLPSAGGPSHFGAAVLEADGDASLRTPPQNYGECDDTWRPGRVWDATSTPSARLWDGGDTGLSVAVVSQNADGSLTVTIGVNGDYQKNYLPLVQK